MGRPSTLVRLLALTVAAAAVGCKGRVPPSPSPGLPMLQSGGSRGHEVMLDFGAVLVNSTLTRTASLQNLAINDLIADPPELTGDGASAFTVDFEGEARVPRLETRTMTVRFSPVARGPFASDLRITVQNGHPRVVTVHLRGEGIALACNIAPGALDFGRVPVGTERELVALIANPTPQPWRLILGDLVGPGFALRGIEPGEQVVPPHTLSGDGQLAVRVVFTPEFYVPYAGVLQLPLPTECGGEVPLSGIGVEKVLFCDSRVDDTDPSCGIDFGATNPGRSLTRSVIFRNTSAVDIYLTYGSTTVPPEFGKPFATLNGTRRFRIPAGGEPTEVPLQYKPLVAGQIQTGTMQFNTTDRKTPRVSVKLRAASGGPWISATPAAIDFSDVAVQTYKKREVLISNAGNPIPGGDLARLLFGVQTETGLSPRHPEIIDSDQFAIEFPTGFDDGVPPSRSLTMTVKFVPLRVGQLSATLRIYSNDPELPHVDIPLTGLGVPLPPCDFEVNTNPLEFGYVEFGHIKDLNLAVVNRSPNPTLECIIGDITLTPDAAGGPGFSLLESPAQTIRIPGNTVIELPIRFQAGTDPIGAPKLEFYISNPTTPYVTVPLSATTTLNPKLVVRPPKLEFGNVGVGCNSRERRVELANDGTVAVKLESVTVRRLWGNVFRASDVPTLPLTIAADSAASIGVTYRPIRTGDDDAHLVIKMVGDATPFVVPLYGSGLTNGAQEDHFVQQDPLPLDVLVVVDNGPTMASKVDRLSTALQAAVAGSLQRFAFQLGITTAGANDASDEANGRLLPLDSDLSRPRVLTRGLPNLPDLVASYLDLSWTGRNPKPIKAAKLALSAPASLNENIAFFRPAADLAIVLVTDAADTDTAPVSNYLHAFLSMKEQQRERLTVSGIVPTQATAPAPSSGCSYASANAGASTRLRDLINAAGGVTAEVCDADWSQAFGRLLDQIYARRRGFVLRGRPESTASLQVFVDDAEIPQLNPNGTARWQFDALGNAVVFDPSAAPLSGSDVRIRYSVACL